ncbi:hypothetical protein JJC56_003716 [Salmonella enterica]|nr:hypothetical protein [Salmonella enterica]EJB7989054.1 hypothetical protein [Salmonella enterica]
MIALVGYPGWGFWVAIHQQKTFREGDGKITTQKEVLVNFLIYTYSKAPDLPD